MNDFITQELERLHADFKQKISKLIGEVLKEHQLSFDNPDYYSRVYIKTFNNGRQWLIDGIPVFWESTPVMSYNVENNKVTMSIQYKKL